MLVFSVPVAKPNINGIVKGQPVRLWILCDHFGPFYKKAGGYLTAPTILTHGPVVITQQPQPAVNTQGPHVYKTCGPFYFYDSFGMVESFGCICPTIHKSLNWRAANTLSNCG
jgi:hypothetical protein